MKPYSIVRRLIGMVLVVELAAALCVTTAAFLYERHTHFRAFDVLLRGRADSILGAVQDAEDPGDNVMLDGSQLSAPPDDVYEVRDDSGRLVGRSENWTGLGSVEKLDRGGHRHGHGPDGEEHFGANLRGRHYGMIRISGYRVVDPGEKGGGVKRTVSIVYGAQMDRVWDAVLQSVSFYAVSSVVVMALTALLMLWLLHRGLRPLLELAGAASRVTVNAWEFEPPPTAQATRELAPLTEAMQAVLRRLREAFEEQQRFVGDAAHELKTGVALVKSSLQLLGMKPRSQTEYIAGLERALGDCERMEAMVAQMLTLARIEQAPLQGKAAVAEGISLLREVIDELAMMAELKQVRIELDEGSANTVTQQAIAIEPEQFKLFCRNVLMNAIQHSASGSEVRVQVREEESSAIFEFQDHGDGIGETELPYVFERFSRGDPSRSRHSGGTGLGLAICKAIVVRARGGIKIESKIGVGTCVSVRIPMASGVAEMLGD
ncbi:sensor histidine kinase [Acidicapsa dinghuensis]|uniref:histidine kinase n=1 Tax=Acidicapsa dinghuensis TaxID=2218256 RepID=A0ABW1EH46_9BACT|nr:HAMP domain-containing sensor histidine kinase [Acidicapsa dinghuensis]